MKTRSSSKKTPQIIEILSQNESVISVKQFKNDESDCSSVESDSCSSFQSDSQPFMNLAPVEMDKTKKSLKGLKKFLRQQQSPTGEQVEEQIKRAPVLNLLRPITHTQQQNQNKKEQSQDQISVQPPSLQQSQQQNPQIVEMSQPKKKPKLMDQLQKQLNKPTQQYQITGLVDRLREQRKKQYKKRDYLIQKKMKQYKIGKKKDTVSNQVFNAIQDFFA